MTEENYNIIFEGASIAEANKLAIELSDYLSTTANIQAIITKESEDTQDIGTIISIVLGSTSLVALAKGLSDWLIKKQSRKLTIKKNGDIIGENLSSRDIKSILDHTK